jgi:iron complex outermembrane receptor protein
VYKRQDRDGAPANGLISARTVRDKNGNVVVQGLSNCTFNVPTSVNTDSKLAGTAVNGILSLPSICGTVNQLSVAPSANTNLDPVTANFLANPQGRLMPSVQDYGLKRNYYHLHLNINYDIGDSGFSVSSLTGMNREKYGQYSDMDNYGSVLVDGNVGGRGYYDLAYVVERKTADFSQELRLAYDNGGPIQGTVGLSYLNNWTQGSNGSLTSVPSPVVTIAGLARSRTKGAFFGLSYKPTSQLTINAEGRYQSDTLYAYARPGGQEFKSSAVIPAGIYAEGETLLTRTYNNFLPRVIAQYDFGREAMIYASWAKGVNPGQFNTGFLSRSPAAIEDAATRGIRVEVSPEKVTNYEVGIKGRLVDGRLNYALSAYYAQWRDQANLISYNYVHPNDSATPGATEQMNGQLNTGSVDMKGVELDLGFRVSDLITLGAAGSFNDSYIKGLKSTTVSSLTGITDFTGKEMPFASKWSANANIEFHGDVVGLDDSSWFARADYMFKSGVWSNQANIAKTPNIHKVNVRAGITRGPVSLEGFVTNLLNNKAFTSIGDNWIYTADGMYGNTFSALVVGLPEVRTGGLQIKYKF